MMHVSGGEGEEGEVWGVTVPATTEVSFLVTRCELQAKSLACLSVLFPV